MQRLLHALPVIVAELGWATLARWGAQRRCPAGLRAGVPAVGGLSRDAQVTGDLGLGGPCGEQLRGGQAALFKAWMGASMAVTSAGLERRGCAQAPP